MKPFLCVDLTKDKKNEQINGSEFLIEKPSAAIEQALQSYSEKADETINKSKLPLGLRIAHWICGAIGLVVAAGILKALVGEDGVSLGQAYQNAAWLFWLAGCCLFAWLILKIISAKKENSVLGSEESQNTITNLNSICDSIFSELSVPAYASDVDILSFFYKVKDDSVKVCEKGLQLVPYLNPVFKMYVDSENLYLANLEGKYAIPLSSLRKISTVKKNIGVTSWNKEEDCNEGRYKQYKITTDNYGCIHFKPYHILEFTYDQEDWGIYFPCYALPVVEALLGMKAE